MRTTCNIKETDAKYLKINCISQISLDNKQRIHNNRKLHEHFKFTGSCIVTFHSIHKSCKMSNHYVGKLRVYSLSINSLIIRLDKMF